MTEAGRKALPWLAGARFTGEPERAWEWATEQVALIEAEATAAAEQRLRAGIEALPDTHCPLCVDDDGETKSGLVLRFSVLNALSSPAAPRQGEPVDVERLAE